MSTPTPPTTDPVREQAEAFVRERVIIERAEHEAKIADALRIEQEVTQEFKKLDDQYWSLARRDFDAAPDEQEAEVMEKRDATMRRLRSVSKAVVDHRERLALLDDQYEIDRRVRAKVEQLSRGRNGNDNENGGKTGMSKTTTKRVPVPDSLLDRIVKLVQTKSQQEVADILNGEGLKTASGKEWTPQNVWHAVHKRTGKGVPRKAAQSNGGQRKRTAAKSKPKAKAKAKPKVKATAPPKRQASAATKAVAAKRGGPISKASQAAGTSRGGTGSRKRAAAKK